MFDRLCEAANILACFSGFEQLRFADAGAVCRNLLRFNGKNFVEDVAHAANFRVWAQKASSLARAAPLAIVSKAISIPCLMVAAWLPT